MFLWFCVFSFHCGKKTPPCSPSKKKNPKFKTRANWGRNCWVLGWPFRSRNVSQVDISEVEDLEMMKRKKRWPVTLSSSARRDVHRTCCGGSHRHIIPKDELIDIGGFFFGRGSWGVQNAWIDWWFWGNVSTFEKHVYEKSPNHDETSWWIMILKSLHWWRRFAISSLVCLADIVKLSREPKETQRF